MSNLLDITPMKTLTREPLHSGWMNGLGMDSMPSAGQIKTTAVPRHTTRPSWRVSSESLNGSSGSGEATPKGVTSGPLSRFNSLTNVYDFCTETIRLRAALLLNDHLQYKFRIS